MNMNLGKLWEIVRDSQAWCATVHAKSQTWLSDWTTKTKICFLKVYHRYFSFALITRFSLNFVCVLSCFNLVQLFATPWAVACQAPLSMELSWHECWSGLPFPSPGSLIILSKYIQTPQSVITLEFSSSVQYDHFGPVFAENHPSALCFPNKHTFWEQTIC